MPFGFGPGGTALEGMPLITAANPAALAALPVGAFGDGQMAYVVSTGKLYVLRAAISAAPDAAGFWVIPTADDALRQWGDIAFATSSGVTVYTPEIDLTAVAVTQLLPPLNYRMTYLNTPGFFISQRNGTVTSTPTARVGTNATNDDVCPSQVTNAALGTQAVNTRLLMTAFAPNNVNQSLAANGLDFEITVGAVLGTATVFKARFGTNVILQAL